MEIKMIENESDTSKAIFEELRERKRFRKEQDLKQFQTILFNKGKKVIESEYLRTYQRLQEAGVGTLVIGRRGKRNRFIWFYSLKKIAEAAKTGESLVNIPKLAEKAVKKSGRPRGRPRKSTLLSVSDLPNNITLTLNVPPELLAVFKKMVA